MKGNFLIAIILLSPNYLWAQKEVTADSICFNNTVIDYSMDASGGIFITYKGGTITKYSADLDSLFTYSPTKVGDTKLLEAGNGLYIFAFYDFFQEYVLTDRFLARPIRTHLPSSIDYIDLATQSNDNNIWLVENTEFRLIKYNATLNRIETETALNTVIESSNSNFTFLKEYQNQVFLVDAHSGIYVFDNLGNFSRKINARTNKIMFDGDTMNYIEDGQIVELNLYSNKSEIKPIVIAKVIGYLKYKKSNYFITTTCLYRTF